MMINSVSSQSYAVQQTSTNNSKTESIEAPAYKTSQGINNMDTRKNAMTFIENATSEELEQRVN
ncbi:hypothetical protein FGD67_01130 [Colwellia sp. M166]|uniref:hypothetical protein n=1 Tax=Colwellia sp. M166 TaxID=2583805 RepID=UPI00211E8100|nr:hypothetical protein [Colwellia sp. M166]UUO21957.1 hypothetical protein FGD67_01130 [Colwellia sp. M166]|tara:strand:+ start:1035 stop:1226 length:192 start_codon:yes stop_codon:yes gene_type:complete